MFGHDNHDDNQAQDNTSMTPAEPVADGHLAIPDDLAAAHDAAVKADEPTSTPPLSNDAGSYIMSGNGAPDTPSADDSPAATSSTTTMIQD